MCGVLTAKEAVPVSASSHLSEALPIALDQQDNVEEELEALEDIHADAGGLAIDAESNVAVVLSRLARCPTMSLLLK